MELIQRLLRAALRTSLCKKCGFIHASYVTFPMSSPPDEMGANARPMSA
jgi:hypothetical protein